MTGSITRERLSDLLVDPREDLDFEVKNWLDLQDNNEDKATFAKAVLALANHGGGFVALGLVETETGIVEAEDRPSTLDRYNQDLINGIVQNYCDPPFHCAVHFVSNPQEDIFPIVVVPGGHRSPVRARRAGPHGNIVQNNAIYLRKPGPRSETPQTAQDWDNLLARCLRNRRDEMFDQIRDLITGAVPQQEQVSESNRLDNWTQDCFERWRNLTCDIPEQAGPKLVHGYYNFSYEIIGERKNIAPTQFPQILSDSVVRHSGWPPFWYPTREGITPYLIDGSVECWLGGDTQVPVLNRDAAHSDFWRIHPDGLAFLLRGYQEDGGGNQPFGSINIAPGSAFDVSLPIWRVGETLLHAQRLAENLFEGPTTIKFVATYGGLSGRELTSIDNRRHIWDGRVSRQDTITLNTHVDSQIIGSNLPEIIHPLLSPLYALFDFFELSNQLVVEELTRMRSNNY
ncbi:hypothetical protein CKO50_12170 [Pseudoalteromonas sp. HM-SA03]|uniref:AlbA family DNA-binding domain-containing protein n=1 Tax=Pseudoalteromonas sp. HM-SA03 TaxID=2029678 RepID=UPI000BAE07BF|nr:RNA-binding domain-containing protein [Pseudoalteromonas sp. HM-SA03]PAY01046.1 hypothetical protein CKO50_12170 [Pseudoalteromonas sp. HM-SA03]